MGKNQAHVAFMHRWSCQHCGDAGRTICRDLIHASVFQFYKAICLNKIQKPLLPIYNEYSSLLMGVKAKMS